MAADMHSLIQAAESIGTMSCADTAALAARVAAQHPERAAALVSAIEAAAGQAGAFLGRAGKQRVAEAAIVYDQVYRPRFAATAPRDPVAIRELAAILVHAAGAAPAGPSDN